MHLTHMEDNPATRNLDPVCGMKVSPDSPHRFLHEKEEYLFCCKGCRDRFAAAPGRYLSPDLPPKVTESAITQAKELYTCPMDPEVRQSSPGSCPKCGMALEAIDLSPSATKTEWTCPMHPEIVRDSPGSCPICGMALEPKVRTSEATNPELRDMSRRFWIAASLSLPLVVMGMAHVIPGLDLSHVVDARVRGWVELVLATPVCTWVAWPFYLRAVQSVKNRHLNMFTLIGLGVSIAFLFSLIAVLARHIVLDVNE